jgi:hypothetical protein
MSQRGHEMGSIVWRKVGMVVAAVIVVGVGCSGNDANEGATESAPTTESGASAETTSTVVAAPEGEPIKLLVVAPLTGQGLLFPETVVGAEAAAKAINDAGGRWTELADRDRDL